MNFGDQYFQTNRRQWTEYDRLNELILKVVTKFNKNYGLNQIGQWRTIGVSNIYEFTTWQNDKSVFCFKLHPQGTWIDPHTICFPQGKVIKIIPGLEQSEVVGNVNLYINPHRPVLSKDFQAFQ